MKIVIYTILAVLFAVDGFAGAHYKTGLFKDGLILAGGLGFAGGGIYLQEKEQKKLTVPEIAALNRDNIGFPDRIATFQWSLETGRVTDGFVAAMGVLPACLMFSEKARKDFIDISLMYSESLLYTLGGVTMVKGSALRTRPYVYNDNPDIPLSMKTGADATRSFYSGHTAFAFSGAVFFAEVFSEYFPESQYKTSVWAASILGASSVGIMRVASGNHFPTDVLTGAFMGGLTSHLILYFHKNDSRLTFLPVIDPSEIRFRISYRF